MAQAPRQPDADRTSFVREIVSDPNNVPDVMLLYGYAGSSSEEGYERLYLRADLSSYVEVPTSAILHRAVASKEQDAHGAETLWVRQDAKLIYKMAPAAQAVAHFFAGAIQAGAIQAGGAGGPGVARQAVPATVGACAVTHLHCQTQAATCNCTVHCPTEFTPCLNTHANTCHCPVTHACSLGCSVGDCTWIGCGHSLACTQDLLCAAPQATPRTMAGCGPGGGPPQQFAAQAGVGGASGVNTCGVQCTISTWGCQTHVAQCSANCPTVAANCTAGPDCFTTNNNGCFQSEAPPCHVGPSVALPDCTPANQTMGACFGGGIPNAQNCLGGTAVVSAAIVCTAINCVTQQFVCWSHRTLCCATRGPECLPTRICQQASFQCGQSLGCAPRGIPQMQARAGFGDSVWCTGAAMCG